MLFLFIKLIFLLFSVNGKSNLSPTNIKLIVLLLILIAKL